MSDQRRYTPWLRTFLVVITSIMLQEAQGSSTPAIAFKRVLAGQPEILVAASDGSNEQA